MSNSMNTWNDSSSVTSQYAATLDITIDSHIGCDHLSIFFAGYDTAEPLESRFLHGTPHTLFSYPAG